VPAKFILPFLYSFAISVFAIFFLLRARFLRSDLKKRLGGVVVILVFVLLVLFDKNMVMTKPIAGILAGGLLILIFGLWDDLKSLSWKWQLFFQIIVALVAISFGVRSEYIANPLGGLIFLTNPITYYILYTLYFVIFINSLNWLDGIDGLSGSVTLTALGVIFFLSLLPHINQPAVAILAAIAGGAVAGFLVFNWHPAKIIAGTSGAWFFGFLLASLSIFAGAKIATVLMAALVPILDMARVVWERHRAGQPVFFGKDGRHLHDKLIKLGWSEGWIALSVCALSALSGFAALMLGAIGKMVFIAIFSVFYFWGMRVIGEIKK
jgi:UDP-GlcNAc:undecaprenyl-phosphate GlcNAc-1-phosphate transferase